MSDELEPAAHDAWSHRHSHLSTLAFGAACSAPITALVALSGPPAEAVAVLFVVIAVALFAFFEALSLVVGVPLVPAAISGTPADRSRSYGSAADGPEGPSDGHDGPSGAGGFDGGGGGGDGGGG